MQPNLNSDYVTYHLEEEELLIGSQLNYLQRAVIQNQRVEVGAQLIALTPSTMSEEGKETYWQQEAYLRGQLSILSYLIDKSDTLAANAAQALQDQSNQG